LNKLLTIQISLDPQKLINYSDHDSIIIEERNTAIRQIRDDMQGLMEIQQEIGETAKEQGEKLEQVQYKTEQAEHHTHEATHELAKVSFFLSLLNIVMK
jgi:methyl-accepting chemotaxis protein